MATEQSQKHDLVIKDFQGVNTQASRTAIDENEFSWLENAMPVGYANMKIVPYQGTAVATIAGVNINYMKYANISNTDYQIVFTDSGAGYAINLSSFAVTLIGAAATFTGTVAIAQWKNERILIIANNNYWSWDPVGGLVVLGGTTSAPATGSTIATFSGRVWIGSARTVTFSAPNSYTDFRTANAGGSFIITDETLHSNINSLFTANNFLYVIGDSSINVVSDVRVSGSTTLFSNTNISAQIGSNLPLSVFAYGRTVAFATQYGFYGIFGATPQKMSDNLDGILPLIDFTKPVSGDVANIFDILCASFLFNYKDPSKGARGLLAIFFNKKWFFASQGDSLTLISGGFQSANPALFATDGSNIYKLFSDTTTAISSEIQTALWSMKHPTRTKQSLKAGVEATVAAINTEIDIEVDSNYGTISTTALISNTGQWQNAVGTVGQWQNNALTLGDWVTSGFRIFQGDIGAYGRYIGYTLTSTTPGFSVNGILMQYELRNYWGTRAL